MCGRGRFAILAAHEVDEYAQQRPRARRAPRDTEQHRKNGSQTRPDDNINQTGNHSDYKMIENLSPGMEIPVIFKVGEENESKFAVENMVWGIIPTYLTNPITNDHYRMFNKRIESLEKGEVAPYFKTVLQTKRCVVVLDGFYEWKLIAGKKHPHYVSFGDAGPMKMAGIYEESNIFDPKIYAMRFAKSFSIITGDPCPKFSTLHTRMPVFLTDEQVLQWLECPPSEVFDLLHTLKANCLDPSIAMNTDISFFPVTPKVTAASYQEADCCQYKSIGQTLSSFFRTPYSPPVKASSGGELASKTPMQLNEDGVIARIGDDITAAEAKESDDARLACESAVVKSELGKRSSVEPARNSSKKSLFTSTALNLSGDSNSEGNNFIYTPVTSNTGRNVTSNNIFSKVSSKPTASGGSSNNNNSNNNNNASAGNTKAKPTSNNNNNNKKAAASPGIKPITSFFARSPAKEK